MISRVDLMTGCRPNFFYQIISAGRTDGHGGPRAAGRGLAGPGLV